MANNFRIKNSSNNRQNKKIKNIKKSVDKKDVLRYYINVADEQRYKMCA